MKNKRDVYRGKDCIKRLGESLREHAMEKKKLLELSENQQPNSYVNAKFCYICKEKIKDKHTKDKNYHKVRNQCHYTGVLHIAYVI